MIGTVVKQLVTRISLISADAEQSWPGNPRVPTKLTLKAIQK
jgi:hypothetical protein